MITLYMRREETFPTSVDGKLNEIASTISHLRKEYITMDDNENKQELQENFESLMERG